MNTKQVSHASLFPALALTLLASGSQAQSRYDVVTLELLDGREFHGQSLNEAGLVLGFTYINRGTRNQLVSAFWHNGHFTELPAKAQSLPIFLTCMNDSGLVAGYEEVSLPLGQALIADQNRMLNLGTLGGPYSYGLGINNRNVVVGYSNAGPNLGSSQAFLWKRGKMTLLPPLDPLAQGYSYALALNEHEDVVGWSWDESWNQRPVLWPANGSGPIQLSPATAPAGPEQASDINEAGQIVGFFSSTELHAFLWKDGEFTDLGVLPEAGELGPYGPENVETRATAINDLGQIVGNSSPHFPDPHFETRPAPFLWQSGEMHNLNDLTNLESGYQVASVIDINNAGVILARLQIGRTFEVRTALLVPVD